MVSGEAIKGIPGIRGIGDAAQNIWMERGASSEARAKTIREIGERQDLIEKGFYPLLNIFPEGATTNRTSIIQFKKGAFVSLNPIRPVVFRYREAGGISVAQDITGIQWAIILTMVTLYTTIHVDYLPIFKPNDYFWENHWHEGKEEKWEAYARAVRAIMAEHGNYKLSDLEMQDKLKYKQLCKEEAKES